MATKLINLNFEHMEPGYVYIGRPTKWGNSFPVGTDTELNRTTSVWKYALRLSRLPEFVPVIRKELKDKTLACYCTPKMCHGDVLVRIADGESPFDVLKDLEAKLEALH